MIAILKRKLIRPQRRRPALHGVLALWISLGLQPCAAAIVSDSDCPHCPSEVAVPASDMHAHMQQEHCGGSQAQSSTDAMLECCELGNGAINSRSSSLDLKPLVTPVAAPPPTESVYVLARSSLSSPLVDPPDRKRRFVPLRKLYCVYRD